MSSLKEKLSQWLKKTSKTELNSTSNNSTSKTELSSTSNNTTSESDNTNKVKVNLPLTFNNRGEIQLFENNSLIISIQKATHQRRTRFQLQDSLFKIKVHQKESVKKPLLLKDLLEVFEVAFKFILNNLRTYFTAENHHVAYLTMYQEPMINGINTGKTKNEVFFASL